MRSKRTPLRPPFADDIKLSTRKSIQLIRCYARELSTVEAAEAVGVSRPTAATGYEIIRVNLCVTRYYRDIDDDLNLGTLQVDAFKRRWRETVKKRGLRKYTINKDPDANYILRLHRSEIVHRALYSELTWERGRLHIHPTSKTLLSYYEHSLFSDILELWKINGVLSSWHSPRYDDMALYARMRWGDLWEQALYPHYHPFEAEWAMEEFRRPETMFPDRPYRRAGRWVDKHQKKRARKPK